jgi:hypothetical protein
MLAAGIQADEPADRAAIDRVIAQLNQYPPPTALFTADSDAPAALRQLWKARHPVYRVRPWGWDPASTTDHPTVTISHEPWGEATINLPGARPLPPMEMVNPRIVGRSVRFLTPEVALAEGVCVYDIEGGGQQRTPLLFVLKKEGNDWKIASLRVLAQP